MVSSVYYDFFIDFQLIDLLVAESEGESHAHSAAHPTRVEPFPYGWPINQRNGVSEINFIQPHHIGLEFD